MASFRFSILYLLVAYYSVVHPIISESSRTERIEGYQVHYLSHTDVNVPIKVNFYGTDKSDNLEIFCSSGESRQLNNIWKTVSLRISCPSPDYEVYQGNNATRVIQLYKESQGIFYYYAVPSAWKSNRVEFSLYNKSCIGVYADTSFAVVPEVNYIDFWKILRLTIGIFLFFSAPFLSCNIIFYYSTGVLFGIFTSLLIVVFVLSRFIPKRAGAISVLVGGWAIVLYFFQLMYSNLKDIALRHQNVVVAYLLIVGFISFCICYKFGQVTDQRTRNLIKWTLQVFGLLLVFFSAEWKEATMSIVLLMLAFHNFPAAWTDRFRTFWRRKFPPKIRLLSEDEYHEQVAAYTRKALEDLREHCNSPECKSWTYVKKLKSPTRFAEFVEGNSHLTDDEILNYELEHSGTMDDDDSFSESDIEYDNGTAILI